MGGNWEMKNGDWERREYKVLWETISPADVLLNANATNTVCKPVEASTVPVLDSLAT